MVLSLTTNNVKQGAIRGSLFLLSFQKSNVLVSCGSADVADSRQFRHIQLLALVCGVVAEEVGGDVLSTHLRSPDLATLGSGIFHARPHSRPYHRQFQLTDHACHLEKCFAHGVSLTISAIQSDAAHDNQPKMLSGVFLFPQVKLDLMPVSHF